MRFFRKKITESEFAEVLANCTKIAREVYKRTLEYRRQCESIIKDLDSSVNRDINELLSKKDAEHFGFSRPLKDIASTIREHANNGLKDLKAAMETKRKPLEDFTITLFGRTKAGKSTIRESLTKDGDGSTIGLGYLHHTKEAGDYRWKGLRILDTPGVEGYKGEKETEKAREVIDQTDIVIFLTTDESQQPGEFDEMKRLIEINKPFFVILNIKDKLTEPIYLKRFLKYKARLFDKEVIEEHKKRIINETKRIGINNLDIIWISALASCIAQFAERSFKSQNKYEFISKIKHPQIQGTVRWFVNNFTIKDTQRLWQLSQIDKVYERIAIEVNSRGRQRRILTFFDSIIYFIDTIIKMLWEYQRSIRGQAKYMLEKRKELRKFFDGFIEESNLKIESKCEELFTPMKEWVPYFVDNYLGGENAQSVLKGKFTRERNKIEKEMNNLMDEIVKDLQAQLHEFSRQYQYDIGTIRLEPPEIGSFKKGQIGKVLKWSSVGCGATSGIAFVAAANFWNPVGWIALGVSVVTGFLSWLFEKDEEKKWLKAKREAKKRLWNRIDKLERKTRGAYKTWFYKEITTKGRKAMLEEVDEYIDSLFSIANNLKKYAQQLMELQKQMNKELFTWLLQLEGVDCSEKDILSIAREQGVATKILITDSLYVDDRVRTRLKQLCNEPILIFRDTDDIREKVIKALYPAKLSAVQINITQEDDKKIAKVQCPDKEKGICIGKKGVNIRLASQVCGIKIETI